MVYIGPDGKVVQRRSPWRFSIIKDIFAGVFNFFSLFFSSVTGNPDAIQAQSNSRRTEGNRYGGTSRPRGSNIRGVKHIGPATAAAGG